ncbi:hypothetical protein FGM00_12975 [Aggregatimonas sangjinii]|uniref:TonB-dependent receptor plug domain-containing protein n=1 Tax=Aggregatimonas sangjinii TaxID=2583587 RepID=A0A5B7SW32_9FLAO|nr:carboxypeptidase-like regulatory domain-containing protein [Aggregatimonas sangjinii]QCX00980.1 hypothetical protein FGM00_12975 [Aggregatimonas sangjinii]
MRLNDRLKICIVVLPFLCCSLIFAQEKTITGTVVDEGGIPLPGVTVIEKGTRNGTVADFNGSYSISVADESAILMFSYIGMQAQEIPVEGRNEISVTLSTAAEQLDDVVVVGYGRQKKESVVGAISVTEGDDLLQAGGVTNVGEALQGRLPGVIATSSSGLPGQTDPRIFIRGQGTWNGDGGQPLILIDGVVRDGIGDIDVNDIKQISVLKDASATAVFGVRGGNGVILITTKRGLIGEAQLTLTGNATVKSVSKLPRQLDSYSSIGIANEAILYELAHQETSWNKTFQERANLLKTVTHGVTNLATLFIWNTHIAIPKTTKSIM